MTPINFGVRVERERGDDPTIARPVTARTAFVGRTLRGPVDRPVFLKSFAEFQHIFGGLWQPSPLGYAVEQFFDNGGRESIVVRVVNGARSATLTLAAGAGCLMLRAVRPGTREFLRASVDYDNIAPGTVAEFNLTVQRVRVQGTQQVEDQEIFSRMSVAPGADRHVAKLLGESELVELAGAVPTSRPDRTLDAASGLATRYVNSNADGDDGAPLTDYDLIGSETARTGLFALEMGDYFNLLCIPPLSRDQDVGPSTLLVAARYCKERRALLIVDPPAAWHTADDALLGMRGWEFANENALMYFPRILAHDKLRGHFECFAPCGAVAGMLARSDTTFPVWGPAKMDDAILRPGFRPSCLVSEDRRKRLAALGVNTIQAVRSAARIGVSPRTLAAGSAGAADWQSLAARRMALFILNSVERGTRWAAPGRDLRDQDVQGRDLQDRAAQERDVQSRAGPGRDVQRQDLQDRTTPERDLQSRAVPGRDVQRRAGPGRDAQGDSHRDVAERVATQVRLFFERIHEAGGFGDRPLEEAYFVICDGRLNPALGSVCGEFHLLIGFAASRRREFHSFRISHSVTGSRITPASLNRLNATQYSPEELDWLETLAGQLLDP